MVEKMKSLQKYLGIYQSIGKETISRDELVKRLKTLYAKTAVSDKAKEAFTGVVPMVIIKDDKVSIDYGEVRGLIEGLCKMFGTDAAVLFTGPAPAPGGRKGDNPNIATVPNGIENPQTQKMKKQNAELSKQLSKLNQQIKDLQEENQKLRANNVLTNMEKKVDISTVRIVGKLVDEDIFLHSVSDIMGTCTDVSKVGGIRDSFYKADKDASRSLTVRAERAKWAERLFKSSFLQKLFHDSCAYEKSVKDSSSSKPDKMNANRRKSVELLLADETLSNRAKLALYAGWHEYHGTEMEDLLNYAGDHCLEANYVIRLLERPDAANNYQNVRGFLRQACKASEARMKREAAKEMIAGEWYVIAQYNGKACRFQMFPVEELLTFEKYLREGLTQKAILQLDKLLGTYKKAAFVDGDPEKELVVKNAGYKDLDDEYYAEASKMIHQYEEMSGIDANVPVDDDSTSDDFKEYEEASDGEQ